MKNILLKKDYSNIISKYIFYFYLFNFTIFILYSNLLLTTFDPCVIKPSHCLFCKTCGFIIIRPLRYSKSLSFTIKQKHFLQRRRLRCFFESSDFSVESLSNLIGSCDDELRVKFALESSNNNSFRDLGRGSSTLFSSGGNLINYHQQILK